MYFSQSKQASILLYVMLLINIALVVGVVVYNNSYVIVNNIDIGNNQEEVFSNIYEKGNIAIESVKKYNSNGNSYVDGFSCPTNITMSGSTQRETNIPTTLIENSGDTYCQGTYNGNQFRIYYNDITEEFDRAVYWPNIWWNDSVDIVQSLNTNLELSPVNIAGDPSTTVSYPTAYNASYSGDHINDNDENTDYVSQNLWSAKSIELDFGRELKIGRIIIKKPNRFYNWQYWSVGVLDFKDATSSIDYSKRINLSGMNNTSYEEYNLGYSGLANETQFLELVSYFGYLDLSELEVYEVISTGTEEEWIGTRNFYDGDSTIISFNTDGLDGDGVDDDLNSDNYKVTSHDNTYYPNNYQDDDVVPRKTIFGSIPAQHDYHHVYWNNYKTLAIIDENTNNDDILNEKMGDVDTAHMYLNTFNSRELDYNIKILEFDRGVYEQQFTLLPLNAYEGKNIGNFIGYIQLNSGDNSLSIAPEKTGNEFEFDFQNKDYAIFFANNSDELLSYHLEAYTPTGTGIYINPIDDSGTGTIRVLSNHIIIGGEKNFIGENFEVVGLK